MADTIFGGANRAEFYEWDGSAVGALLYTCTNIADSDFARNGDLTWNAAITQDEDSPELNTFIESKVNADSAGGGSTDRGNYEDGTPRPTAASSGSGSVKLVVGIFYGGKSGTKRKVLPGFWKMLPASGSYKQSDGNSTDPTLAFQSVDAPAAVNLAAAGDITLNAGLVDAAHDEDIASGSKGAVVFPTAA